MKKGLRKGFRERREKIGKERREEAAERLKEEVMRKAKKGTVLSFWSMGTEVEMKLVNEALRKEGRLALPRIHDGGLEIRRVKVWEELEKGPYGLMEPGVGCERLGVEEVDWALVPGLAFDEIGHRLGYGMGYYDRCLAGLGEKCVSIGVGFKEQWCERVPDEEHDVAVKEVLLV